jgi:hypothetical protein
MRALAIAAIVAALGACGEQPDIAETPPAPAAAEPAPTTPSPVTLAAVDGWEVDPAGYALAGKTAPAFSIARTNGGAVSQEELRGRWTILGFWSVSMIGLKDEAAFIRALNSAADQDPDLDFLGVHIRPEVDIELTKWFDDNGGPWPTLVDDGKAATSFSIGTPPKYLLVGPDLTIHAYRGALASTPDNGIKSVIQGVAEIKKQLANPS